MGDMIDRDAVQAIVMEECWQDREMKLAKRIESRINALPAVPTVSTRLLGLRSIVRKAAADAREVFDGRKRATEAIGYMEQLILAATMSDALDTPAPTLAEALAARQYAPQPAPDAAAIREAALREAAKALENVADNWSCGHMPSHCDCARDVDQWRFAADEILALITEKPHDR